MCTVAHNGNTQIYIMLLHSISQYTNTFIGCASIFTSTINIHQYNNMYPSTEIIISVQKQKLQYGKISPILSTQITAPVKKISISQYKNISSRTNIFIGCATIFFSTVKFMYTTVQQYLSQYKNINLSTKIKVAVQKIKKKMERKI